MVAHPLTGPIEGQTISAACVEWEPGMTDVYETSRSHAGEEFIHVTEGAVEVTVKGRTILLREGDSLHFRAGVPHRVVNRFAEPCRAILIMTPVFGF
jgi:quercetin dioxygenase-like cupin family protein